MQCEQHVGLTSIYIQLAQPRGVVMHEDQYIVIL